MRTTTLHDEKGIKDLYRSYRENPDHKLTYKDFSQVCFLVNKKIATKMLEGKIIKLPFKLGRFYIRKRKLTFKHLKLDYNTYNKTGLKTFFINDHSSQFYAKWFWEKISCRISGSSIYSFIPARANKRALAKEMKVPNGFKKYIE